DVFTGRSRVIIQSLPVSSSFWRCLRADIDHGPQTTPDDRLCRKGGGLQPFTQNSAASSSFLGLRHPHQLFVSELMSSSSSPIQLPFFTFPFSLLDKTLYSGDAVEIRVLPINFSPMAKMLDGPVPGGARSVSWPLYHHVLTNELTPDAKKLLITYSKIPPKDIEGHIYSLVCSYRLILRKQLANPSRG
ncbi:MAG: hypothetical protein Q9180_006849, partial [Flavoplaca navasiana]